MVEHYTIRRVIDVDYAAEGRDLGSTTAEVRRAIASLGKLPPATKIVIRGQSQAMRQSFTTLGEGIILAIVLVYLLMVANFQSWLEPMIILTAIPGALAGVLWMQFRLPQHIRDCRLRGNGPGLRKIAGRAAC